MANTECQTAQKEDYSRHLRTALLLIAGAFVVLLLLYFMTTKSELGEGKRTFRDIGGDFSLISHKGPTALSDFKGEVRVLYFGFASCRAVCPVSMATIAQAINKLSEEKQNKVRGLLVSIDPIRDTAELLEKYAKGFHPRMIGLTGNQEQIDQVKKQYAVYDDPLNAEGLEILHTSRYYIINSSGDVVDVMRHSTTINELTARLKTLLY